jgi:hypothetical protein
MGSVRIFENLNRTETEENLKDAEPNPTETEVGSRSYKPNQFHLCFIVGFKLFTSFTIDRLPVYTSYR